MTLLSSLCRTVLLGACSLVALAGHGQTPAPAPCATEQAMRQRLGAGYDAWWRQYRDRLQARDVQRALAARPATSLPPLVIPIVIHIIYDSPTSNITDEQVNDAIRILNEDYHATNADTAAVLPYFKSYVGNANIEFRLARRDPSGNCTNGITRTFSRLTNSADDNVKGLINWDVSRYLNVYVVNNISFGAAGYAYLPCWVGPPEDGIVILNGYIGSIGKSSPRTSRALTHEVGHYLGLPHTWGSTNNPGPGLGNCNDDDGVSDTPNTEGSTPGNCNLRQPSCPGDPAPLSNVQNYMDYSYCSTMFTAGQCQLMNDGIATDFFCRVSMASAANLQITGVADGMNLPPCAPTVAFAPTPTVDVTAARLCAGDSIRFQGTAYNVPAGAPLTYQWSFPGGSPAASTLATPRVQYATPGAYPVSLTITSGGQSGSLTQTDYVHVGALTGLTTPLIAGFEDPQFPLDPTDPLKSWSIVAGSPGPSWQYTNAAAAVGTGAVRLALQGLSGVEHQLVSPTIVTTQTLASGLLRFRVAYAQRAGNNDILHVAYSYDCGRTWTPRLTRQGTALAMGTPSLSSGLFVPGAAQWHELSMPVGRVVPGQRLLVRFAVTGDGGNALYLDDVRLEGNPLGINPDELTADALAVVPNPSDGRAALHLGLPLGTAVELRIYDATGRLVGRPAAVRAGHDLTLADVAGPLTRGLYLVELRTAAGQRRTVRALVQ